MSKKYLVWCLGLGAIIICALAIIVVSNNRATVAREERAKAEARADAEASAAKKARAEEQSAASQAEAEKAKESAARETHNAAKANQKAEADALKRAQIELDTQEKRRAAAEAEALIAARKESVAKAQAEQARLTNETALAVLHTAEAKQNAAFLEAEKVRLLAEKAANEAKTLELRKADLEAYEQSLLEVARDLAEREEALRPEKTVADLVWLPDADNEVDENGRLRPRVKEPYLAENDKRLPKGTRELARQNRLREEALTADSQARRDTLIAALKKLRQEAEAADRPLAAGYYRKVLESLYPDWTASPDKKEEKVEESNESKKEVSE